MTMRKSSGIFAFEVIIAICLTMAGTCISFTTIPWRRIRSSTPPPTISSSTSTSIFSNSPLHASWTSAQQSFTTSFIENMCESIGGSCSFPVVLLNKDGEEDKERGLFASCSIPKDSEILRIPLSICLRDDEPPEWLYNNNNINNPNDWATRLAASFLDLNERLNDEDTNHGIMKQWVESLPSPSILSASLPVHWSDEALSNAKCCALELAVDSAYFSRAEAVEELLQAITHSRKQNPTMTYLSLEDMKLEEELAQKCHSALDIVQTRACRVNRYDGLLQPSLRVVAPVFDYINHGGSHGKNVEFGFDDEEDEENVFLVVRALRDVKQGEELLLDYGGSARPAWKCLVNYGFVPTVEKKKDQLDDDDDDDDDEDEDVAEVFMDGVRYEVTSTTIPVDMVEAATANNDFQNCNIQGVNDMKREESGTAALTASIALRIAKRLSDAAFLLLIPDSTDITSSIIPPLPDTNSVIAEEDDVQEEDESVSEVQAAALAAALRWSQHRVLLDCAMGLRDYASRNMGLSDSRPF